MPDSVRVQIDGSLARLTLCRPPLNILDVATLRALAAGFDRARSSPGVRLLRLDAEGQAFSAGVAVEDHLGDALPSMMSALAELFAALERAPFPTLAVVQGLALGGGCELVLGTDLALASEKASFGLPEIRLGVFAPPASVLLPRVVGERRALELLLTGDAVNARRAEQLGLVNRAVPAESLEREAEAWTEKLLALSGAALRHAKRAIRLAAGRPLGEAHEAVSRHYVEELMRTADAHEGLRAFLDKRPAAWKHR